MTLAEENYLKTIYHLSRLSTAGVNTNAISEKMETKASSVTDMLKKLSEKRLVDYKKYQGVSLTPEGRFAAKMIVRKHRLWEVFLVDKLNFNWDEVHDIAEELEHIQSQKLIDRLDAFLGYPDQDPHGDPIPNAKGEIKVMEYKLLSELKPGESGVCIGVKDTSSDFLKYLDKQEIALGSSLKVIEREDFDASLLITAGKNEINISHKIASNLYIKSR